MQEILNKIIADCPKAWAEFLQNNNCVDIHEPEKAIQILWLVNIHIEIETHYFRNLYDYFDKLDIVVSVEIDTDASNNFFTYEIYTKNIFAEDDYEWEGNIEEACYYQHRTEAEWNAFYEAFKIREGQLK